MLSRSTTALAVSISLLSAPAPAASSKHPLRQPPPPIETPTPHGDSLVAQAKDREICVSNTGDSMQPLSAMARLASFRASTVPFTARCIDRQLDDIRTAFQAERIVSSGLEPTLAYARKNAFKTTIQYLMRQLREHQTTRPAAEIVNDSTVIKDYVKLGKIELQENQAAELWRISTAAAMQEKLEQQAAGRASANGSAKPRLAPTRRTCADIDWSTNDLIPHTLECM